MFTKLPFINITSVLSLVILLILTAFQGINFVPIDSNFIFGNIILLAGIYIISSEKSIKDKIVRLGLTSLFILIVAERNILFTLPFTSGLFLIYFYFVNKIEHYNVTLVLLFALGVPLFFVYSQVALPVVLLFSFFAFRNNILHLLLYLFLFAILSSLTILYLNIDVYVTHLSASSYIYLTVFFLFTIYLGWIIVDLQEFYFTGAFIILINYFLHKSLFTNEDLLIALPFFICSVKFYKVDKVLGKRFNIFEDYE